MTLHTDIPTRDQLEWLIAARDRVSVSVYLPTTAVTPQAQAGRIELKNLAGEAVRQLEESGPTTLRSPMSASLSTTSSRTTISGPSRHAVWRCSPRPAM
ncbi:hypothetical protein ACFSVJ_25610 [Prauserella oleivorans]